MQVQSHFKKNRCIHFYPVEKCLSIYISLTGEWFVSLLTVPLVKHMTTPEPSDHTFKMRMLLRICYPSIPQLCVLKRIIRATKPSGKKSRNPWTMTALSAYLRTQGIGFGRSLRTQTLCVSGMQIIRWLVRNMLLGRMTRVLSDMKFSEHETTSIRFFSIAMSQALAVQWHFDSMPMAEMQASCTHQRFQQNDTWCAVNAAEKEISKVAKGPKKRHRCFRYKELSKFIPCAYTCTTAWGTVAVILLPRGC